MNYTQEEVLQFIKDEDVKFIRLVFCDAFGNQKNISIISEEAERAFKYGIAIDASAIKAFGNEAKSDLFLHPDPSTLAILPWRPEHGRVCRMYCNITYPHGTPFECDTRAILQNSIQKAQNAGLSFYFGAEMEFYLFKLNENGRPTAETIDDAGYMDMAPEDKGENVRREICLTLEQMDIYPESSHHEEGPGQNEIDFKYSSPLEAADNAMTFRTVVKSIANRNGVNANFMPKPLEDEPGNGFHINFSCKSDTQKDVMPFAIAGVLKHIKDITVFLNSTKQSYSRLGKAKAPKYITWSKSNRSDLIRIPAAFGEYHRAELRSPDTATNPYLAFALIIEAAMDGIRNFEELPPSTDINIFEATPEDLVGIDKLPETLKQAQNYAKTSEFVKKILPEKVINAFVK